MPGQVEIKLSEKEKGHLERLLKSGITPVRLVERAQIVLMAADNTPNFQIAEELGITAHKVGRWCNRLVYPKRLNFRSFSSALF